MFALMAVGLPVGFLIGLVGIGGVLLTPALANLFGRDIHDAVALSLASFVMAGAVAAANTRRSGAALRTADWYLLGALVPGALAGSLITPYIPTAALALAIAVCILLAGISCLRGGKPESGGRDDLPPTVLVGLGLGTGLASAVSGTGGPLILVPVLLAAGMEVRRLLAVSQIAQLPIAVTATLANGIAGHLDVTAAVLLSVAVVAGMLVGVAVSRRLDTRALRVAVAWCLVGAGSGLIALDLWRMASAG